MRGGPARDAQARRAVSWGWDTAHQVEQRPGLAGRRRDEVDRGAVAGPTDEGYRIIDIWASREDWERFRARPHEDVAALAPTMLRELNGIATIHGAPA